MPTATLYAKALRSAIAENSAKSKEYASNLRQVLVNRGHQKLLPAILSEYEKLELAEERSKTRSTVTPESERTRILLELYRKLVSTKENI